MMSLCRGKSDTEGKKRKGIGKTGSHNTGAKCTSPRDTAVICVFPPCSQRGTIEGESTRKGARQKIRAAAGRFKKLIRRQVTARSCRPVWITPLGTGNQASASACVGEGGECWKKGDTMKKGIQQASSAKKGKRIRKGGTRVFIWNLTLCKNARIYLNKKKGKKEGVQ